MPRYDSKAIDDCFQLYLQHNGGNAEAIQKGMRDAGYPNWSKSNISKWAKEYNWKDALKLHIAMSAEGTATSAELLFLEIEKVRRRLANELQRKGSKADRDLIYQHRDYCKLSIDALARLEAARDNYAGFAKIWRDLMEAPIPEAALRVLTKHTEEIIAWAREKYATQQADNARNG
jgi:hypothetical protein